MTKRPPEVRNNKKTLDTAVSCGNKICDFCDNKQTLFKSGHGFCVTCYKNYCDICSKVKEFITVRRSDDPDKTHEQMCSDCYISQCNSIFIADKSYGKSGVSERKKDIYDE